ncbi:MAG: winged helix-turn-helix transcriptional regulator [Methanobacteriota archaeon]
MRVAVLCLSLAALAFTPSAAAWICIGNDVVCSEVEYVRGGGLQQDALRLAGEAGEAVAKRRESAEDDLSQHEVPPPSTLAIAAASIAESPEARAGAALVRTTASGSAVSGIETPTVDPEVPSLVPEPSPPEPDALLGALAPLVSSARQRPAGTVGPLAPNGRSWSGSSGTAVEVVGVARRAEPGATVLRAPGFTVQNAGAGFRAAPSMPGAAWLSHGDPSTTMYVIAGSLLLQAHYNAALHHLRILVRFGYLQRRTLGPHVRYFENGGRLDPRDERVLSALARRENGPLVRLVAARPGLRQKDLAAGLGLAKSTVSRRVGLLVDEGVLEAGAGVSLSQRAAEAFRKAGNAYLGGPPMESGSGTKSPVTPE